MLMSSCLWGSSFCSHVICGLTRGGLQQTQEPLPQPDACCRCHTDHTLPPPQNRDAGKTLLTQTLHIFWCVFPLKNAIEFCHMCLPFSANPWVSSITFFTVPLCALVHRLYESNQSSFIQASTGSSGCGGAGSSTPSSSSPTELLPLSLRKWHCHTLSVKNIK